MPRLGPQRRRNLIRILRENGLVEDPRKGKGSHMWLGHPSDPTKATVVPSYETIDGGLADRIIKQAGKTVEEYLSHLK